MSLFKFPLLFLLALFCALFFFSCGLPDPSSFSNESNPPFDLESYSSNNTIFLKFRSFNKDNTRKFLYGYNIYIGFIDEDEDILKRTLYLEGSNQLPSILLASQNEFDDLEISFSKISYSNNKPSPTEEKWIKDEYLRKFVSYYFVVSPYHQGFPQDSPKFFLSFKETIEENQFDQVLNYNNAFSFEKISFSFTSIGLLGLEGTEIQDLGFAENFFSIRQAPEKGYLKSPFSPMQNHVYAYKNNENYGKIFVKSLSKQRLTFDFSYQGKKGEREI